MKSIIQGIKNLIYWLPIIWRDRNWDQHYIYEVLKHKLKAQSDYISKHDRHTRAQSDARDMRTCVNLIQKIQDDFYGLEYLDYSEIRQWFTPCEDKEGYFEYHSEVVSDDFNSYFNKYPLAYRRVLNGESVFSNDSRQHIAMNMAHLNQKRAKDLLFKIMNNRIDSWWD